MAREKRFDINAHRIPRMYWIFMFRRIKDMLSTGTVHRN